MSVEDVARKAMRDKGLDEQDHKLRSTLIQKFLWSFHHMAQQGWVSRVAKGPRVR